MSLSLSLSLSLWLFVLEKTARENRLVFPSSQNVLTEKFTLAASWQANKVLLFGSITLSEGEVLARLNLSYHKFSLW